jgi:transcriptional regulator with XRE-family HTH domain
MLLFIMVAFQKKPKLVGAFIRERRVQAGLSQKALGMLFVPPVTTQFISNVERGVTPFPPAHLSTLIQALAISYDEILKLLEQEYAYKLNDRVKIETAPVQLSPGQVEPSADEVSVLIKKQDLTFISNLYRSYSQVDSSTQQKFVEYITIWFKAHTS